MSGRVPPHPQSHPPPAQRVTVDQEEAEVQQRRSLSSAIMLTGAIVVVAATVMSGYFVFNTVASVVPAEDFAKLRPGMDQVAAEKRLPIVEMMEAPTVREPSPDCRYYEAEVSFFDRRDVFQVCFQDGEVSTTRTIEAPT